MKKFNSIGEVYLNSDMFSSNDETNKTIGDPAIGPNAVEIINNRRKVKGRLTEEGTVELEKIIAKVKEAFPQNEVKAEWDIHCGCSMCPCSPGYRIKTDSISKAGSREEYRFNLWVKKNDTGIEYDFRKAKDNWLIGSEVDGKLQEVFSKKETA